ncbi:MAG: hypothetical protein JW934_01690 [Anaerolineae bacterium]|nr:hypothetical protein [Anaerolineae bacterium]
MSEEFKLGQWVSEGVQGVKNSIKLPTGKLLPEGFHAHMKASRKEFLMAFRSLFDVAIEDMDKPKTTTTRKATKIKVE